MQLTYTYDIDGQNWRYTYDARCLCRADINTQVNRKYIPEIKGVTYIYHNIQVNKTDMSE